MSMASLSSWINRQAEKILSPYDNHLAVFLYRISHRLYLLHVPVLPLLLQHFNAFLNGCEIHYRAEIGKKFTIVHSHGVVIGPGVKIGNYCVIYAGALLGVKHRGTGLHPTLGDEVIVYAGAKVLGPVRVGNQVRIGANAVVIEDVPGGVTVAGVPARILHEHAKV